MFDEIPIDEAGSLTDCCESAPAVQVWMIGQQEPLEFEAYPDEAREEESDVEARFGQLNLILADLEGTLDVGFVSFLDGLIGLRSTRTLSKAFRRYHTLRPEIAWLHETYRANRCWSRILRFREVVQGGGIGPLA